jgi:hypothetical protein
MFPPDMGIRQPLAKRNKEVCLFLHSRYLNVRFLIWKLTTGEWCTFEGMKDHEIRERVLIDGDGNASLLNMTPAEKMTQLLLRGSQT